MANGVTIKLKPRSAEKIAAILEQYNLSVWQRLAVRALMGSATRPAALEELAKRGVEIDKTTLSRWMRDPEFQAALARAESVVARGITKNNVLRKTEVLLEEAMAPKPILYKGEDTGFREIELGTATRLVELQGKAVGLFEDESAMKIAVLVDVDFSGRKDAPVESPPVLEGEFAEAVPSEPRPTGSGLAPTGDDSWLG